MEALSLTETLLTLWQQSAQAPTQALTRTVIEQLEREPLPNPNMTLANGKRPMEMVFDDRVESWGETQWLQSEQPPARFGLPGEPAWDGSGAHHPADPVLAALLRQGAQPFWGHAPKECFGHYSPWRRALYQLREAACLAFLRHPSCPPADQWPEEEISNALSTAAKNGMPSLIDALLDHGLPVNACQTNSRTTALFHARESAIVERLLARGADPEARSSDGLTVAQHWTRTLTEDKRRPLLCVLATHPVARVSTISLLRDAAFEGRRQDFERALRQTDAPDDLWADAVLGAFRSANKLVDGKSNLINLVVLAQRQDLSEEARNGLRLATLALKRIKDEHNLAARFENDRWGKRSSEHITTLIETLGLNEPEKALGREAADAALRKLGQRSAERGLRLESELWELALSVPLEKRMGQRSPTATVPLLAAWCDAIARPLMDRNEPLTKLGGIYPARVRPGVVQLPALVGHEVAQGLKESIVHLGHPLLEAPTTLGGWCVMAYLVPIVTAKHPPSGRAIQAIVLNAVAALWTGAQNPWVDASLSDLCKTSPEWGRVLEQRLLETTIQATQAMRPRARM